MASTYSFNHIFFSFSFIFISWRLITLQYCSGFCHTTFSSSHIFSWVQTSPDASLPKCTYGFLSLCLSSSWTHPSELVSNISIKSTVYPLGPSSDVVYYSRSMPLPPPPLPWIILVLKLTWNIFFFFLIEPNCRLLNGVTTGQPLFCEHCQFSPSEDVEYLWSVGLLWRCIFLSGINWWKPLNTCWGMEVGGFNRTVFFRIL